MVQQYTNILIDIGQGEKFTTQFKLATNKFKLLNKGVDKMIDACSGEPLQ